LIILSAVPYSVSASSNNSKGLSEDYLIRLEKFNNERSGSDDKTNNISSNELNFPDISKSVDITDSGLQAGQTMITNAGKDFGFWAADSFLQGGFKFASVGVEEKNVTDAKTPRYTLYSKELKPFSAPVVKEFVLLTFIFHVVVCIIFILLGNIVYILQKILPREVSKFRAGFSGEESYFDIKYYMLLCCGILFMPFIDSFGIWYSSLNRNVIVSFMTTRMIDVLGTTSDNLPTYLLVNLSWYVNMFEKVCGEYTVYLLASFVVVKSWIMAVLFLFGSIKQVAVFHFTVMFGFILVLIMDIITLFFVSFGVELSVWKGNWGYTLTGMITACFIDALILVAVALSAKHVLKHHVI
jgi:hypothetical protein